MRERYATEPEYRARTVASVAASRQRHLDEVRARERAKSAKYRATEGDRQRARVREANARWKREHPDEYALLLKEQNARRRALTHDPVDYAAILNDFGMVCHLCGGDVLTLDDLHMDHVVPLARGGEHTPSNVRPAHALCNLRKGARLLP